MKKFNEISIKKKIGKYLFNKEFFEEKRKIKSKSPSSATAPDSPKSNFEKKTHKTRKSLEYIDNQNLFIPIINDNDDPFLFESKINNNPFLSNIKKNHNLSMKLKTEKTSKSFMKVTSKITINNNINDFIENIDQKLDFSDNNTNLFANDFINDDILYNERILDSFSLTNFNYNFNKKINDNDIILPTIKINNENKVEFNNNNVTKSVILSEKENIVIEALIALDKDYYEKNKDKNENSCDLDIDIDTDVNDFEKIFKIDKKDSVYDEKNKIYTFIDNRIKQYYNYYKKNKIYKLDENQNDINTFKNEINNILIVEKININISFFSFKSIVMGLYLLVINWLSKSHFKVFLKKIKENNCDNNNNNNINLDIFIELMEKYNTIKDICPFLEKDFKDIIDDFQQKKDIKFCLCELLTDLFWDYVFKIHHINNIFTNGYTLNNNNKNIIFEEAKHSMKAIIDILIVYDNSYKKNIGEILDLPYVKNKNIFLMSYILEFKKKANPFIIKNPCIEKEGEKNENNEKNKNNKDINNKTKNKKEIENKNTENFSLEEVYKYIQGDDESKKGKKKNKRRQKKKKNKNENKETNGNKDNDNNNNENNNVNNDVNNETEEIIDPVVEEFIQYFIDFNKNNINCVKLKPIISEEWIKSLS